MKRFFTFIAAVLVSFTVALQAQVPHTMSYQGLLLTPSGATVIDSLYTLQFKVDTNSTGGNAIWTETQANVRVWHGTFNVILGSATPGGIVIPSTDSLFVEVTATAGPIAYSYPQTFSPRTQVTSAPYSLAPWVTNGSNISYNTGNVGIGTTNPLERLELNGNLKFTNHFGIYDSTNNHTLRVGTAVSNGFVFDVMNNATLGNGTLVLNPSAGNVVFPGSGNVGIGTDNPDQKLTVNGDASKIGGGSWLVYSDRRLKTDIKPFSDGLNVIERINPISFRYNGKLNFKSDKTYVGIIAQDVQPVAPYTIDSYKAKLNPTDVAETELLRFDASAFTFITINALKELNTKVKELEKLKEENVALSARLADLETIVKSLAVEKKTIGSKSLGELK